MVRIDGHSIGDSTAIIAELERRFPEPPLYPSDPEEQRRALELEDFFDENYGHEVRRLASGISCRTTRRLREPRAS